MIIDAAFPGHIHRTSHDFYGKIRKCSIQSTIPHSEKKGIKITRKKDANNIVLPQYTFVNNYFKNKKKKEKKKKQRQRRATWPAAAGSNPKSKSEERLLEGDLCADFFDLCLDCLCLFLGDAFLDVLGSALNEFLSFLQAQAGDLTDNLDNLDLLIAEAGQLDVKLGLLFLSGCCGAGCNNNTGCCGNTKLRFAGLDELVQFQNGQLFDR